MSGPLAAHVAGHQVTARSVTVEDRKERNRGIACYDGVEMGIVRQLMDKPRHVRDAGRREDERKEVGEGSD